jgi:hypothetical protein
MSLDASSTRAGVMWLAAPRSSPAPQRDGHLCSGPGGVQLWAAANGAKAEAARMAQAISEVFVMGLLRPEIMLFDVAWAG